MEMSRKFEIKKELYLVLCLMGYPSGTILKVDLVQAGVEVALAEPHTGILEQACVPNSCIFHSYQREENQLVSLFLEICHLPPVSQDKVGKQCLRDKS